MARTKILYVLIDNFADFEWAHISTAFHFYREQFQNVIVGIAKNPVTSEGGLTITPEYDLEEAENLEFNTLILIGSSKWKSVSSEKLELFVKKAVSEGKNVCGICSASGYLATIGILNNVNHTTNSLDETKEWAGTAYTNEAGWKQMQCVKDKNIITANGSAFLEFAREILLCQEGIPEDGIMWWYNFNKKGMWQQ